MFIGHYGVALAAKRVAPNVSLGLLFLGAGFLDFLWPVFVLAGVERVRIAPGISALAPLDFAYYPFSHSLLLVAGWSLAFGLAVYAAGRSRVGAWACALLVASHWFLDALVHRPDLPLAPGMDPKIGLGLWNSPAAGISVEAALFVAGLALYGSATRARDATGRRAFWLLMLALVAAWLGALLGPPPPSVRVLAYTGLAMWLYVAWAAWVDRHRQVI